MDFFRFLNKRDFKTREIRGTTNRTADAQTLFRHGEGQVPYDVSVLAGDVYIPKGGIGPNEVDVRSGVESEPFVLLLYFN